MEDEPDVADLLVRRSKRARVPKKAFDGQQMFTKKAKIEVSCGDCPSASDTPQITSGVQLSPVQGYMAKMFRLYGTWVARNPVIVLSSSLAVVLLLGLGLIRFQVETRPEKLWVGHGSRAAEEKQYFDSHLAPFYRIEQILLATKTQAAHEKQPAIVTEENIKLLFEIQAKVDGIRPNYSGSLVSLTDICMKPLGAACGAKYGI